MSNITVKWNKVYYEELGEKDQNGFYDYAYHYWVYLFSFPSGDKIRAKKYMDEPDECSLFLFDALSECINDAILTKLDNISAVINFLRATQNSSRFTYFNHGYELVDLNKIKENMSDFLFVEEIESGQGDWLILCILLLPPKLHHERRALPQLRLGVQRGFVKLRDSLRDG